MKKLLFIIAVAIILFACKSKEKVIDRSVEKTTSEVALNVDTVEAKDIRSEALLVDTSETIKVLENKSLELVQADPEKEISITQPDGQTLTVKGANVKIVDTKSKETKRDSSNTKLSNIDKSNKAVKKDSIANTSSNKKKRTSNSDVKTTSTWLWVLLIITAVVFFYYKLKK